MKFMIIPVTEDISLKESELRFEFSRASGPGGQNVNKVSSAVQLRFDICSPSLPDEVRLRLQKKTRKRINQDGDLIINARRYRSQERNRQDAIDRLVTLIQSAAQEPVIRKKTKPTQKSKERRLAQKRRTSEIKKLRRNVPPPDD